MYNQVQFFLIVLLSLLTLKSYGQDWSSSPSGKIYYNQGNVGIGVADPRSKLDVNGGIAFNSQVTVHNPLNRRASVNLNWKNNISRIRVGGENEGAANGLDIQTVGDRSLMRLLHNGNVGIGTTTPDAKLTVQGFWDKLFHFGNPASDDTGRIYSTYEAGSPYLNFIESDDPFVFNFLQTATGESIKMGFHKGNVGIGTTRPDSKLSVNGNIRAKEVKVETTNWPDYVFGEEYKLLPLLEVKKFIRTNGHLPGFKSAAEYEKEGVNMLELNQKLVEKIEELTLYLIQQEKVNQEQAKLLEAQQKILEDLIKKTQY